MNQTFGFRLPLAYIAILLFGWLAQAQSLDDVHIEPRHKPSATPSPVDATSSPGLPATEVLGKPFRVNVDLVLVPVTVTDEMNRPVTSLHKQDFALYEGEKPQEIRYFFEQEEPISVAVLLDVSNSMTNKIEAERDALKKFFENANPQDEYFAITFSNHPRLIASSSNSIDQMQHELMSTQPGGATAMLDAIYLAEAALRNAKYKRRAIIIISDGDDNVSHHSHKEIRSLVQESDAQVYAIGLFEGAFIGAIQDKLSKQRLSDITDCTGGRTIAVRNRDNVPEAAAAVSREIRSQYVLGYRPSTQGNGKWRKIKVRIASSISRLRASYKQGYISLEEK